MLASNGYCAQQLRCMSTPPDRYTHTEDQIEKNKKLVEGHKKFHRKDYAPASMTPHIPATSESLPLNPAEIAVFNGFPSEHQKRTVIIAPRPDKIRRWGTRVMEGANALARERRRRHERVVDRPK